MTDDLIYRLRAFRPPYGWPEETAVTPTKTLNNAAADALEAKDARISALEATIRDFQIVEAKQKEALNYFFEKDTDYSWRYKREEAERAARAAMEGKDD